VNDILTVSSDELGLQELARSHASVDFIEHEHIFYTTSRCRDATDYAHPEAFTSSHLPSHLPADGCPADIPRRARSAISSGQTAHLRWE
jgi:hypothetical protein